MGEQVKGNLAELLDPKRLKMSQRSLGLVTQSFVEKARIGYFDNGKEKVGMELELVTLDDLLRGYPIASRLTEIKKIIPYAGPELPKIDIEFSFPPEELSLTGFQNLSKNISNAWEVVSRYANIYGTGIIENIDPKRLDKFSATSGFLRYIALNENLRKLMKMHGRGSYTVEIGNKRWEFNNIYPEGLITSVQTHIQIPKFTDIPKYLNTSFIIYPILLYMFSNSPIVNGELTNWMNSRILWFEELVNTGENGVSRCYLGSIWGGWYRTPDQPFWEVNSFQMIIPAVPKNGEVRPEEDIVPEHYKLLAIAGGTVWPWSRVRFGWGKDPHVRMEIRPVCAQPTPIENLLVAYLSVLLVLSYLEESKDWVKKVEFRNVRENFYGVARGNYKISWLRKGELVKENIKEIAYNNLERTENWARKRNLYHPDWFNKLYYILERGSPARVKLGMLKQGYSIEDTIWSCIRAGRKNQIWRGD